MHSIPDPALHFPRSCTVDSITRFPRTRIFLPWVRIFFYIISIPSSYYLKYLVHRFSVFFERFIPEIERKNFWISSSPIESHQPNELPRLIFQSYVFDAFSNPNYGLPPETRNQWKSFTRNNHEFIISLSRTVTRQRHNYIIRCTLLPAPLHASRTCGTRNPMRARVPMGTGNEMVVTVSQPLRRWTAGMHPMMLSVGDCSLGHGDDTGPARDPP